MFNNFNYLNFNLLPWRDMRRQRQHRVLKIALSVALSFAIIVVGLWHFLLNCHITDNVLVLNNSQQELQLLQQQAVQQEDLHQRIVVMQERDNFIKRVENEHTRNIEVLVALSQIIPPFIYFTAVHKNAELITIVGKTIALKAFADFMQQLGKTSWIRELTLQEIKNSDANNIYDHSFVLQLTVK